MASPETITPSYAFFEALWDAGVTHCFVNLGSDHPSLMAAMIKGKQEKPDQFPRMITCPNEMVAMSMADGYARLTNKPQCVIVHVDVGTQGLGAAVHNASCGRAPVLIFAGLSPYTIEGEMLGSRTEFIHWVQDIPDQKQIVAQYCRYSAEIKTGANIKQMVNRALQFASSAPQGPVYLCAAREVMEEEIKPYQLRQEYWDPVERAALPSSAVINIANVLTGSDNSLIITGYSGRNHATVPVLVTLADMIPNLRVLDVGGSDMCFPADHPASLGLAFGVHTYITKADVILVIECDVPWINNICHPQSTALIFHIDVDPLKQQMSVFYLTAKARYRADCLTALLQIKDQIIKQANISDHESRRKHCRALLQSEHDQRLQKTNEMARPTSDLERFGCIQLCQIIRKLVPEDAIFAIEAVTSTVFVSLGLQVSRPGSWINCGGGGLGWSGGGALGIKIASDFENKGKGKFVVHIVGDGSFMFSIPSSVYWISQRYRLPILTIVLNNAGWHAPKRSLSLVHPTGAAMDASNEDLNISFNPHVPDYAGIAVAASGNMCWGEKVSETSKLEEVLKRAVEAVKGGRTAVVDAVIRPGC